MGGDAGGITVIGQGKYARLVRDDHWEWVERTNISGVVIIVAVTPDGDMLFVEQHRPPVKARVIELPAGLAGDIAGQEDEALAVAATRELEEETGWTAATMTRLTAGPVSAGLVSEQVTFFRAAELTRVGQGGGDDTEDIEVHAVPLDDVPRWLADRERAGVLVDPKVYAALWFERAAREG